MELSVDVPKTITEIIEREASRLRDLANSPEGLTPNDWRSLDLLIKAYRSFRSEGSGDSSESPPSISAEDILANFSQEPSN